MWPVRPSSWFQFGTCGFWLPALGQRGLRTAHCRHPWHAKGRAFGVERQLRGWPGVSAPHQDIIMTWKSADARTWINLFLVHIVGWLAALRRGVRRSVCRRVCAPNRCVALVSDSAAFTVRLVPHTSES